VRAAVLVQWGPEAVGGEQESRVLALWQRTNNPWARHGFEGRTGFESSFLLARKHCSVP